MKNRQVEDIVKGTGGRLLMGDPSAPVRGISLDSRVMKEADSLFVPIAGERVDSHRFICQALGNGAVALLTSRHHSPEDIEETIGEQTAGDSSLAELCRKAAWIQVEDTKAALQALGSYLRGGLSIPLVGITGSVGKTTTREMVAAALSPGYEVYKTPGNSNSQVGVPITLSEIPDSAGIGVIELGMSEPGEMTRIASIARVNSALMTNIGVTHIQQLGSQENILREKLHIQDGMSPDGMLFLNGDDPILRQAAREVSRPVCLYGFSEGCDVRGRNLRNEEGYPVFEAEAGKDDAEQEKALIRLKVMGNHMALNALAALAVARHYGVPLKEAGKALEGFEGYKGRQQIFQARGCTIIDDSYNASPVSMKAGLEVLSSLGGRGRTIAVLADMKELGPDEVRFHRQIGEYIGSHPHHQVVLLGELARQIGLAMEEARLAQESEPVQESEPAQELQKPVYCSNLEEIKRWLEQNLEEGDTILFKGSNSMRLSQAVAWLKES